VALVRLAAEPIRAVDARGRRRGAERGVDASEEAVAAPGPAGGTDEPGGRGRRDGSGPIVGVKGPGLGGAAGPAHLRGPAQPRPCPGGQRRVGSLLAPSTRRSPGAPGEMAAEVPNGRGSCHDRGGPRGVRRQRRRDRSGLLMIVFHQHLCTI